MCPSTEFIEFNIIRQVQMPGLDGYDITYNVVEPRIIAGGVSTLVGTNDGSLVGLLTTPA